MDTLIGMNTPMVPVRVAVVGAGFMGMQHIGAIARHPLAQLAAVVDVREDAAGRAAEPFGVKSFSSAAAMLAECDVQAVCVCTSDDHHREPTLTCLAAGKHVLVEKPIATTLADADAMIAAARQSSAMLMVGHIVRFDPRYAHVKERADAGEFGRIQAVFARRLNSVASQDLLRGRVSVIDFLAVHDIDYLLWLVGDEPVRVHTESVAGVHRAAGMNIEDHTFTLIRFAGGAIACIEAGWILPRTHVRGADFKLEVIGEKGMAQIDLIAGDLATCTTEQGWRQPRVGHAIDAEIAHFIDCVMHDRPPLIDAPQGRAALRVCLAARESATSSEVVRL